MVMIMLTGECFCGAITYQIDGKVRDARSCHCSRCRKVFSAQASAYALVDKNEFTWLTGQEKLTSYMGEHGFGFQFCTHCGSTLCGVYRGDIHGITLGCLNEDPEIEIGYHLYVGSRATWEALPVSGKLYEEGQTENEVAK
tara:strand:- start:2079 stop:2501 length:423 start_codon:yes stop_codon:yes gene_type:complete